MSETAPLIARVRRPAVRGGAVLAVVVVAFVLAGGLLLRRGLWDYGAEYRFSPDVRNAYRWGEAADRVGYLNLYAATEPDARPNRLMQLDYPPLRLWVMTCWARWAHRRFPDAPGWQPTYAFNAPLLWINTACEVAAAAGAFLLVSLWSSRAGLPRGAVVRWRWRAPRLSWSEPEAVGDPPRPLRVPRGALVQGALAALLLWFNPAVLWDAHVWPQWDVWAVPFFLFAALLASLDRWATAGAVLAVGALLKGQVLLVAPLLLLWPLLARRPAAALRFCAGFAAAGLVAVSPWLVHGDMSWYRVGYAYGTRHYPRLHIGDTPNLAALLQVRFGWTSPRQPVFSLGAVRLTLGATLTASYGVAITLCAWCAARCERRNDPAGPAALAAPWLLMFALLPQMHERYLVFGAAVSAVAAGAGALPLLLHLLVTALSVFAMLTTSPRFAAAAAAGPFPSVYPDAGWVVLLAAAVLLFYARGRTGPGERVAP